MWRYWQFLCPSPLLICINLNNHNHNRMLRSPSTTCRRRAPPGGSRRRRRRRGWPDASNRRHRPSSATDPTAVIPPGISAGESMNEIEMNELNSIRLTQLRSSRPWSHYGGDMTSEVDSSSSVSIADGATEATPATEAPRCGSPTPSSTGSGASGHPLRRFRKSFSLRLSRRSSHDDTHTTTTTTTTTTTAVDVKKRIKWIQSN